MKRFDHDGFAPMARQVRERRTYLGWSRSRLSRRADVSYESIINIERGIRVPSLGLFLRVLDALGMRCVLMNGPPPCAASDALRRQLRNSGEFMAAAE